MNKKELEKAYSDTTYTLHVEQKVFRIYIGKITEEFEVWLRANDISSWTMMTAANPYSKPLSGKENKQLNAAFQQELEALQLQIFYSEGIPQQEDWAVEKGFFIANISLQKAKKLAENVQQNAIVFAERGEAARLIWLV
ncbi:MAG: DUF3293 domain-containing protein [Bacteroidota bacterium]